MWRSPTASAMSDVYCDCQRIFHCCKLIFQLSPFFSLATLSCLKHQKARHGAAWKEITSVRMRWLGGKLGVFLSRSCLMAGRSTPACKQEGDEVLLELQLYISCPASLNISRGFPIAAAGPQKPTLSIL